MHHSKVGRIWGFSSIQFKPFSLAEMAEVELLVEDEIKCLKKDIKSLRKDLGRADVAKEELLMFEMLDKYPHIPQQQAWPWRWGAVDALYTFTDKIPAWVVDDTFMAIWVSGEQGLPNSYTNWDSKNKEAGMALMLSRAPSCLGVGTDLEGKKVYSTVVVFVHPKQELLTIQGGGGQLTSVRRTTRCRRYRSCVNYQAINTGDFILAPSTTPTWSLPYCGKKGKPKQLRLDFAICYNHYLLVCHLHWWEGNMATWHSCHLYSQQILPFLSYFQSGILANYGTMTYTTRRLLQVVPGWWLYVPPSVDSHAVIKK